MNRLCLTHVRGGLCNRLVGVIVSCTRDVEQTTLQLEAVSAELAALRDDLGDLLNE